MRRRGGDVQGSSRVVTRPKLGWGYSREANKTVFLLGDDYDVDGGGGSDILECVDEFVLVDF